MTTTRQTHVRKAVFPVAGMGTRFLPATMAMPKELPPIIDKPIIQYAVEEAVEAGIDTLIFVTGRHKRAIEDHFDANPELEAALKASGKQDQLEMVRDMVPREVECIFVRQHQQLGLGHAVACADRAVAGEPFAVLLADDFIVQQGGNATADLLAGYATSGKTQISVMQVDGPDIAQYGVVRPSGTAGGVAGLVEKPNAEEAPSNLASIGRYVLEPDIFDALRDLLPGAGGEIQLADAINILAEAGRVDAVRLRGQRYDCGSKMGYLEAILDAGLQHPDFAGPFAALLDARMRKGAAK